MKTLTIFIMFSFFISSFANASSCGEIKGKIVTVRDSLMGMLKDKTKRTPEQKKLVVDSSNEVSSLIDALPHGETSKAKFDEMKKTWDEFKKVREEKVVPLIEQGKDAEAEKLATGEQKERLMKVMKLCDEIK